MNNINLANPNAYYPEILTQELSSSTISCENPHYVIVKAPQQEDHILSKTTLVIQAIFNFLFQMFECMCHYARLLANGLISIKTKLIGIDLHLHFHLFTVNINYDVSNPQNTSPSGVLAC
ncbi:hypothetical protein [Candidatus Protochlamydia amoebophila]|uniref:Uncharacterized protein n=1 Tax=Protochlamydia amoebophila (strain UWE25) TaxID=264201 RepID=Q6M9K0_PARUW|nr:hypothetical protein [Candidatus Protochlamydia amoebophila]CAF24749.1 unnamed protein product [Candidatus Protochlamydia amoebophila UWE25]